MNVGEMKNALEQKYCSIANLLYFASTIAMYHAHRRIGRHVQLGLEP